jgi:prepilin-type N-terminal cleavage/methylation domain-containing protein
MQTNKAKSKRQPLKDKAMAIDSIHVERGDDRERDYASASGERGFSLAELMIAMIVFTIIGGSVFLLLSKSQTIFRTEQGVSEMDQNARLLMDFMTRDIQQMKENGLGLGEKFRSLYSFNGPDGKTDEVTIVSAETETKVPAVALPLIAASTRAFNVNDHYVELMPSGVARIDASVVANAIAANEEFLVSGTRADGAVQFDFIKVRGVRLTQDSALGISFDTVQHSTIQPVVPFGETYDNGNFTLRPCTIKRYYIDRTDKEHPSLALSVNDGTPIRVARNVVAFQLRYLEVRDGEVDGTWVKQQNILPQYKTQALEVTMTARTEISGDDKAERLVTLASVIRPRFLPVGVYGSSDGGNPSSPGLPGEGNGGGGGGYGDPGGNGNNGPGGPGSGRPAGYDENGQPLDGSGSGNGSGGLGGVGYNHETRRIGKAPKLGERLNPRP